MTKEERTKEEQVAHDAKMKEIKDKRNNALNILFKFVVDSKDEKAKTALATVKPSLFGIRSGGGGGSAAHDSFLAQFEKIGATVNETKIFTEIKAGRKECAQYIKRGLKKADAGERKWVNFDSQSGNYKLVAIGENAPKNWTGYQPVSVDVDELK